FFFFQAEDGIRDLTVTGVQTCALPICCAGVIAPAGVPAGAESDGRFGGMAPLPKLMRTGIGCFAFAGVMTAISMSTPIAGYDERSEERRVGEEGRVRWARVE